MAKSGAEAGRAGSGARNRSFCSRRSGALVEAATGGLITAGAIKNSIALASTPYENSADNQGRMSQGKAPIGKDGNPVELHHEGQSSEAELREVTQTEHRGGDNFQKNHTNTGQKPSQIDRSEFQQQRKQYWKDKAKQ